MILEPVWTAVMSVVWLDEKMTSGNLLGCGLILLALLITRWRAIFRRTVNSEGGKLPRTADSITVR